MNDDTDPRTEEALFRYSVLGDLTSRKLARGELKAECQRKAAKTWIGPNQEPWVFSWRTIEKWYYDHKHGGLEALARAPRKDKGTCRALAADLQELVLDMKREQPLRSAAEILEELEGAGRTRKGQCSRSTVQRLLAAHGLSGPAMELERPARYRWQASTCGELWQGDCCHGPLLFDAAQGRPVRAKIFALLDDKSRLVVAVRAFFHESQMAFLSLLLFAVLRRGIPRALYLDNHGSFNGGDVRLACARLGINLLHAEPYDAPAKGKIERWWRSLRRRVLSRLEGKVETLDDLNLRLSSWVEGYYNQHPHAGLGGRTPLSVWEEDADAVRWVEDRARVEDAFIARLERRARNDATCQVGGTTYEVPPHLRRQTVVICYCVLRPEVLWIEEGGVRVFLQEVDAEGNARRPRPRPKPGLPPAPPSTGLDSVEDLLKRLLRPEGGDDAA